MAEVSRSFYLTLPSNGSMTHYPNNKPQHYKIRLPKTLILRGEWEVALVEVLYPNNWFNFETITDVRIELVPKNAQAVSVYVEIELPAGNFRSVRELCKKLETALNKRYEEVYAESAYLPRAVAPFKITYDSDVRKVSFRNVIGDKLTNATFRIRKGAATHALGLEDGNTVKAVYEKDFDFTGEREASLVSNFPALFFYCGVVENQIVGDTYAPLLRTVPIRTFDGEVESETFTRPFYLPVRGEYISEIEVQICNDAGNTVKFQSGKVMLQLHFRKASLGL